MSLGSWCQVVLIEQHLGLKVARLNQSATMFKRHPFSESEVVPEFGVVMVIQLNADQSNPDISKRFFCNGHELGPEALSTTKRFNGCERNDGTRFIANELFNQYSPAYTVDRKAIVKPSDRQWPQNPIPVVRSEHRSTRYRGLRFAFEQVNTFPTRCL